MKTINNTKITVARDLVNRTLVDGSKVNYPTWRVQSKRVVGEDNTTVKVKRRFSHKKFGGNEGARRAAWAFAVYLQECSDHQYLNANRRPGRPFESELYADISLVA